MKKKVFAAAVLLPLTFVFGLMFQRVFVRWRTGYVPPCTVTEYRAIYKILRGSDFVNVRGFLYGGDALYLGDGDLAKCDESLIGVDLHEDAKIAAESERLIRDLRLHSGGGKVARAEVEIVGVLEKTQRGPFATPYVIKVHQILPAGAPQVVDASEIADRLKDSR